MEEIQPNGDSSEMEQQQSEEREWSGRGNKPKYLKTFWETVPPISPYPRPGNFFIAPSKPGYYTILDLLRGRQLQNRPKNPYLQWGQNPNPFFRVDFTYLDDPNNTQFDYADFLKRIHIGDNWLISTGGEIRDRYATIQNAQLYNKKPYAGADDTFNLFRARVYADFWYRDDFRLFVEGITAYSSGQSIPMSSTDVEQNEFLNLFIEAKLFALGEDNAYVRVGRQEMLFGSQRLVSPSDWSNARRTFQGVRAYYHTDTIEEDIWVMNPVIPDPQQISSIDDKQVFAGNYFKYRFNRDISMDMYYMYLENDNSVATGQGGAIGGYDVHTLGGRFIGEQNQFLWDFEGAVQAGKWSNQDIFASMGVAGVGYWFKNVPTSPTLWAYYDYASGTQNPSSNLHQTFNPLFPFGHTYFAGLDTIGRENIRDFHVEYASFVTDWFRVSGGYHALSLDSAKDALYSPSGSVVRQDTTGKSGTDVGQATQLNLQFHIDNHNVILLSWSHLYAGTFIKDTAINPAAAKDLNAYWIQYTYKW
jgi:hypothetical protein